MSHIVEYCPWQNWMAAYLGYTPRMKTLFRGWPVMVHDTHTRRRRLVSCIICSNLCLAEIGFFTPGLVIISFYHMLTAIMELIMVWSIKPFHIRCNNSSDWLDFVILDYFGAMSSRAHAQIVAVGTSAPGKFNKANGISSGRNSRLHYSQTIMVQKWLLFAACWLCELTHFFTHFLAQLCGF